MEGTRTYPRSLVSFLLLILISSMVVVNAQESEETIKKQPGFFERLWQGIANVVSFIKEQTFVAVDENALHPDVSGSDTAQLEKTSNTKSNTDTLGPQGFYIEGQAQAGGEAQGLSNYRLGNIPAGQSDTSNRNGVKAFGSNMCGWLKEGDECSRFRALEACLRALTIRRCGRGGIERVLCANNPGAIEPISGVSCAYYSEFTNYEVMCSYADLELTYPIGFYRCIGEGPVVIPPIIPYDTELATPPGMLDANTPQDTTPVAAPGAQQGETPSRRGVSETGTQEGTSGATFEAYASGETIVSSTERDTYKSSSAKETTSTSTQASTSSTSIATTSTTTGSPSSSEQSTTASTSTTTST